MKAVIFAAGLGTRLAPFTNDRPKALVKVDHRTLLELTITYLRQQGLNDFIINIHHHGQMIIDYLSQHNNFGVNIQISDERDTLLDTGGALKKMQNWLTEDFILFNVDILSNLDLKKMIRFHEKSNSIATVAVRDRSTSRYLLFDDDSILSGWTNIKTDEVKYSRTKTTDLKPLAFSGIHIISPKIFNYIPDDDVFSIIPWYLNVAKHQIISGYQHDEDFWLDVGKIPALEEAKRVIKNINFL